MRPVLVDPDELAALESECSRAIEIECFGELSEIDPAARDRIHHFGPDEDRARAKEYTPLDRALEESGRVGTARFA